jgi:hypothetical protein
MRYLISGEQLIKSVDTNKIFNTVFLKSASFDMFSFHQNFSQKKNTFLIYDSRLWDDFQKFLVITISRWMHRFLTCTPRQTKLESSSPGG